MTRASSTHAPSPWPFWLLIAAWLCANSPQAATYAFLSWMAEAGRFSHQQRLTLQLARVMAGADDADEHATQIASTPEQTSASRKPATIPESAVLKKLDLAVERTTGALPAFTGGRRIALTRETPKHVGRAAPPHGPPRAG